MSDLPADDSMDRPEHESSPQRAWEIFSEWMKQRGLRMTQARKIVFDRVFERHDHFSVDELAEDLTGRHQHVAHSTIYSTLSLLVEADLVCEITDPHGGTRYEHAYGHVPHEHMICQQCDRIFEFADPRIRDLIVEACNGVGFSPHSQRVTVLGICRECREADNSRSRA